MKAIQENIEENKMKEFEEQELADDDEFLNTQQKMKQLSQDSYDQDSDNNDKLETVGEGGETGLQDTNAAASGGLIQ